MRVARAVLLGLLIIGTALAFEFALNAAQDTREKLSDRQWDHQEVIRIKHHVGRPSVARRLDWESEVSSLSALEPQRAQVVEPEPNTKRVIRPAIKREVTPVAPMEGVAPEDAIRVALRRKRPAFERCYELELKKQATFDGFVVVSITLSADGRVTDVHLQDASRRDAMVGACIVAQLRQLQLGPLSEEAELIIPIRLQAKKPT